MSLAFNINKSLSRFFLHPSSFRSLQARTGTLISGSTALQFFDRSFYPDTGLDIFVHKPHRREVGRWLLGAGYDFVPEPHQDPDFEIAILDAISTAADGHGFHALDGIASILNFAKSSLEEDKTMKVHMIVAENTPMEVILSTHSTCMMNLITFSTAYCIFPRATLEGRQSLLSSSTRGIYRNRGQALKKYKNRGFDVLFSVPVHTSPLGQPSFPLGWRWLDDKHTWTMPLDMAGVDAPVTITIQQARPLTHDPSTICNWNMQYGRLRGAVIKLNVIKSDLLRYKYILSDEDITQYLTCFMANLFRQEGNDLYAAITL
ncbi:hypothetical protein C8Q76DRAFT_617621 [Earliella scabrosa]|nr:hypothetical protein C8Q76DRAFT_617621 [Earliella scabrosa]